MSSRIYSFPPIISKDSKILILGSIPGVQSLEKQEYYAHPQNQFWKILFGLRQENFTNQYAEKLNFLEKNKIALWDTIESCERKGSKDTEIKNEVENSILELLKNFPNIQAIFCNGQKSHKNLMKILDKNNSRPIFVLPSTSPLHTISLEKKMESWKIINEFL